MGLDHCPAPVSHFEKPVVVVGTAGCWLEEDRERHEAAEEHRGRSSDLRDPGHFGYRSLLGQSTSRRSSAKKGISESYSTKMTLRNIPSGFHHMHSLQRTH